MIRCLTLLAIAGGCLISASGTSTADWPQWRGDLQDGVAPAGDYPTHWDGQAGAQIRWNSPLPGRGGSTPVVSNGTAYLTAGIDDYNHLLAIDLQSGDVRWSLQAGTDKGSKHKKGSGSNPSAVTDGKHVVAYFRSGDLVCTDTEGSEIWSKNLQDMYGTDTLWWDLGSSPLLTDDAVIVAVQHSNETEVRDETVSVGYLVALKISTGDVIWKTDRNTDAPVEASQSYSTPVLVNVGGEDLIAVLGADHATLHRLTDGVMVGDVGGFNPDEEKYFRSIASPAATGSVLVCSYSRGDTVTAIDMMAMLAGKGRDAVLWTRDDMGSDVPTPAVADGVVYLVEDGKQRSGRGTVTAVDAKTGDVKWEVSTPKSRIGFSSSPLIAGDHLYVIAEDGTTHVIGPLSADQPKLIASNSLAKQDGITVASPVPVASGFLIRTRESLYRIGE